MKIRIRAFLTLALLALLPLAAPLQACCDDFWSCCAAVATGGLSCAVEDLVNSVRSMIQNVENLVTTIGQQAADVINLAKDELGGAANDLKNLATQAEGDFTSAAQTAANLVDQSNRIQLAMPAGALAPVSPATTARVAPGALSGKGVAPAVGGASAPAPGVHPAGVGEASSGHAMAQAGALTQADANDVKDALRRAKEAIERMRPDVVNPLGSVRGFAQQAEQQAISAANSARGIAESLLLAPLRSLGDMLTDLVSHPERIFDPSRLVDDAITSVTNQMLNTMNQVHDAVMTQARATLDQARQPMQDALDRAASAKKIAQAMDNLWKRKNRAALEALNSLIPRAPMQVTQLVTHVSGFTHASGLVALDPNHSKALVAVPFNRVAAVKLTAKAAGTQMGSRLKKPWADFKRLQAAPPKAVPEAKPRVDAELERRFTGKTPQQAAETKRLLVAEARTRFAKDPKTLAKVLDLLDTHPAVQRIVSPR